jgi:hypothetical protein
MKTFPLIQDPGHAWARVPRKVLISSGCAGSISNHSMERGNNVYLEQDSDLQTFIEARNSKGLVTKFAEYTNKSRESRIRRYDSFNYIEGES